MPTSRKARPLDRSINCVRDARLVVIASEGEKSEARYFSILRSTRLQVKMIPAEGGRSAPQYVLKNLEDFAREFELGADDQLWLVIDRDAWTSSSLSRVAREVIARGWGLALSNPCFELWLSLHFDEPLPSPATADTLEKHLRTLLGSYNKAKYDPKVFQDRIRAAEERAKTIDSKPADRWPQRLGTRVYKITEQFES